MNESLHGVTQCSRVALLCILLIHSYLQSQTSWHNSRPFKVIEQRQARCTLSTLLNLGGEWVLQQAWEFWRGEGTGSNSNWLCDYEQITVPLGFLFWKITAWKYHLLRPPWTSAICTQWNIFSLKKEGNGYIHYNTDEPWGRYTSKINQSQKDNTVLVHLLLGQDVCLGFSIQSCGKNLNELFGQANTCTI